MVEFGRKWYNSTTTQHVTLWDSFFECLPFLCRTLSPTPALEKGLVYKQGDKLVFQDIEHFEKCAICLEKDYDDYNDQYEAQYPGATAEELDLLDEINLFNEWAPYITFEQSLSFSSLRAKVESQVDTWLSTTPANLIDFDDDPDNLSPIEDESTRALFNEDGLVIIGNAVKSVEDFNDGTVYNVLSIPGDSCIFWHSEDYKFDSDDDPVLQDRELVVRIAIRSGFISSKLRGTIKHYKKIGNEFKLRRAKLKVGAVGYSFDQSCLPAPQVWEKYKGYKKRRRLRVTAHIWSLWRVAIGERTSPFYMPFHCVANAYYDNDNNYYQIWLFKS